MLDKGVVSDQANNFFSAFEKTLMRQSLIGFERMMYGPGDRGSLSQSLSKTSKSPINVGIDEEGVPTLCYTALGKPYSIPQFYLQKGQVLLSAPDDDSDSPDQFFRFVKKLQNFKGKYVYLSDKRIPSGYMLVGWFEDKYYVATNTVRPSNAQLSNAIGKFLKYFNVQRINKSSQHVRQQYHWIENVDVARMYAKIALNVLAYIKGEAYAKHSNFNEICHWVVTGKSEQEFFYLPQILTDDDYSIVPLVPEKSDWCIFIRRDGMIHAVVCFYNRYVRGFTLGMAPEEPAFYPDGFICDWTNRVEYDLRQYINMITSDNHENLSQTDQECMG